MKKWNIFEGLLKWAFTWMIASIPILFAVIKQSLTDNTINLSELNPELSIIGIVMLAEPLGRLVTTKTKNTYSFILTICLLIFIIMSSFLVSIGLMQGDLKNNIRYTSSEIVNIISSFILGATTVIHSTINKKNTSD